MEVPSPDSTTVLLATVTTFVPLSVLLVAGLWPLGARVDAWAAARGVPLTDESRVWISRRLHRSRRWRTVGAAVGWVLPYVELSVQDDVETGLVHYRLFLLLVGYVLGAVAAELVAVRSAASADVDEEAPRSVDDYLPRLVRLGALALTVLAGLSAVAVNVDPDELGGRPDLTDSMIRVAIVGGGLLLLEVLLRVIARRRQPFADPDLVHAEDAVRSWAVHAVAGALLAAMVLVTGTQLQIVLHELASGAMDGVAVFFWRVPWYLPEALAAAVFTRLTAYETGWAVLRWRRPTMA